jgi:hypothetical protein
VRTVLLSAVLTLGASWAPFQPQGAHGPASSSQLEGRTLCIRNPDGTSLFIDSPGSEWQWHEYDSGDGWFAFRPGDTPSQFQDVVNLGRIWGMPDCGRIAKAGRPRNMPASWEQEVVSCGPSTLPEQGSLRLHTRLVTNGEPGFHSVSYYTPHGYHFISPLTTARSASTY